MKIQLRLDEEDKTAAQIAQREASYQAAKILRAAGYEVDVVEYFTGKSHEADAASIVIKLGSK